MASILLLHADNPARAILHRALELDGHHVLLANDGFQAVALLAEHTVDLAVLESSADKASAWQVLDLARSQTALPALVIGEPGGQEPTDLAADTSWLARPIQLQHLRSKVHSILDTIASDV